MDSSVSMATSIDVPDGQTKDIASSEDDIINLIDTKHKEGGRHLILCWTTTLQDHQRRDAFEKRVIDRISLLNGRARHRRQRLASFVDARKIEQISNEKSGSEAEEAYVECFKGCARSNPIVPVVGLRMVLENQVAFRAFLSLSKEYLSGEFDRRSRPDNSFVIVGFVDRMSAGFRDQLEAINAFFDGVSTFPEISNILFTPPIDRLSKQIRYEFSDILNNECGNLNGRLLELIETISTSTELALLPKSVLGENLNRKEASVQRMLERAEKGLPPARAYFPDEWKDLGGVKTFIKEVYGDLIDVSDVSKNALFQDQLQKIHPSKAMLCKIGNALGISDFDKRYGTAAWGFDVLKALKNSGDAASIIPPKSARTAKYKKRAQETGLTDSDIRQRRSLYSSIQN